MKERTDAEWLKLAEKRENDFINHQVRQNRQRRKVAAKITKCQIEGCNNPTTDFLYITDKETLRDVFVCVQHWQQFGGKNAD